MKPDEKRSAAQRDAERRVDAEAAGSAMQARAAPLGRSEVMLKILGRDDTLRSSYVRRRWQGLTG